MAERQIIFIDNEELVSILRGHNRENAPTVVKLEDDGTLRAYCLQVGLDATGRERIALVEADRTPRSQLVLWETTTPGPIRWRGEPTAGEACVSLYGQDGANNLDPLRTDGARIIRTRPFEPYQYVTPDDIPNANTDIYTVPASTIAEVNVEAVNVAAAANITIYVRPSGVAAGVANMIANAVPVAINDVGIRWGPYIMEAGGIVTANSSVANAITVHLHVKEYGTGDAVAY